MLEYNLALIIYCYVYLPRLHLLLLRQSHDSHVVVGWLHCGLVVRVDCRSRNLHQSGQAGVGAAKAGLNAAGVGNDLLPGKDMERASSGVHARKPSLTFPHPPAGT